MLLFMPEEAEDLISGRYLLAEPVSRGGLGRIWRGHDQLLDREVAVTEISLPPRPGEDRADMVNDIMRKVRTAARLSGPGGIMVHDVAEHADALWIVTQPGDGESLDTAITRTVQLPWQPKPSARAPQTAPSVPGPGGHGTGGLAAAMRASTGLTVGVATGIVMVLALILVVVLFPTHHQPSSPPGRPMVSPTASASTPLGAFFHYGSCCLDVLDHRITATRVPPLAFRGEMPQ